MNKDVIESEFHKIAIQRKSATEQFIEYILSNDALGYNVKLCKIELERLSKKENELIKEYCKRFE